MTKMTGHGDGPIDGEQAPYPAALAQARGGARRFPWKPRETEQTSPAIAAGELRHGHAPAITEDAMGDDPALWARAGETVSERKRPSPRPETAWALRAARAALGLIRGKSS